jgi:hypothetical protein
MAGGDSDLLQGTLDVLILKALALQELHGMGISRRIRQMTGGTFDVKAGSLFPALHRMAGGLAHVQLGSRGNESSCKVLFVNQDWKEAASNRNRTLDSHLFRYGGSARDRPGGVMISRFRALWNNVFRRNNSIATSMKNLRPTWNWWQTRTFGQAWTLWRRMAVLVA